MSSRRLVFLNHRLARFAGLALLSCLLWRPGVCHAGEKPAAEDAEEESAAFTTSTLRGRVRFLGPALKERYGIETVPESAERQIVLDVPDGPLIPIAEDIRGRAFRADERLRGIPVEMLVRRHDHSPFVQVIQLFAVKKDGEYLLDYWCDVCAIAMYELKPCDCCQGPNRLRERLRTPEGIADEKNPPQEIPAVK